MQESLAIQVWGLATVRQGNAFAELHKWGEPRVEQRGESGELTALARGAMLGTLASKHDQYQELYFQSWRVPSASIELKWNVILYKYIDVYILFWACLYMEIDPGWLMNSPGYIIWTVRSLMDSATALTWTVQPTMRRTDGKSAPPKSISYFHFLRIRPAQSAHMDHTHHLGFRYKVDFDL